MHLIESYAASCGLKINKPFIYTNFFPLNTQKYISFQPFSKPSKNYDYWQDVINLIHPYLKNENIDIVQIGSKDDPKLDKCIHTSGQTSVPQAAYIIQNSILHFGADSFGAHIASGFDKKILALYANNNIENVSPYWSKKENLILLKPKINKKPSYSFEEHPKSINTIKPEEIASGILSLLNIKHKKFFETIYIGENYNQKTLELILDQLVDPNSINIENLIIRMDYFFNEQALEILLKAKKCIIFTNKTIDVNLLKAYKNNILQIIYIIEEKNDPNFIKELKRNTINFVMISNLPEEILNKYKLNYMDYGLIINKKDSTKEDFNIKSCKNYKYFSSKNIISSKGHFKSKYDWLNQNSDNVIDDPEFWKEAQNFYIYKD